MKASANVYYSPVFPKISRWLRVMNSARFHLTLRQVHCRCFHANVFAFNIRIFGESNPRSSRLYHLFWITSLEQLEYAFTSARLFGVGRRRRFPAWTIQQEHTTAYFINYMGAFPKFWNQIYFKGFRHIFSNRNNKSWLKWKERYEKKVGDKSKCQKKFVMSWTASFTQIKYQLLPRSTRWFWFSI